MPIRSNYSSYLPTLGAEFSNNIILITFCFVTNKIHMNARRGMHRKRPSRLHLLDRSTYRVRKRCKIFGVDRAVELHIHAVVGLWSLALRPSPRFPFLPTSSWASSIGRAHHVCPTLLTFPASSLSQAPHPPVTATAQLPRPIYPSHDTPRTESRRRRWKTHFMEAASDRRIHTCCLGTSPRRCRRRNRSRRPPMLRLWVAWLGR